MDEEKGRQREIREKLDDAGLDPDEFDEDKQPACADLPAGRQGLRRAGKNSLIFSKRVIDYEA